MSYSCAENVPQLSRASNGESIPRRGGKYEDSPTKAVMGMKLQTKQIQWPV